MPELIIAPRRHPAPWRLAAALAAAVALSLPAFAKPGSQPIPLRLIGLNDFHGNLEASPGLNLLLADPAAPDKPVRVPVGGAAALAGLVQTLRAGAPHSLMLSSGDLIGAAPLVSTLFRHESTIAVMNTIGLDLAATGNHEFDAGITELKRVAGGGCAANPAGSVVTSCASGAYPGARFPFLAANVLDSANNPVFAPYVIKRFGGVRVGFIGAVTRTTPSIVIPSGVAGLKFVDEVEAVNRAALALRKRGVKAMVLTIHEGGELGHDEAPGAKQPDWNDASCPGAHGPIFEMAKTLARDIGVIFSAHTHQGYRCVVEGRTIIQATSYGRGLAVVDVALSPRTRTFIASRTNSLNLPVFNALTDPAVRERLAAAAPAPFSAVLRETRPDAAMAQTVAGYSAAVAPQANRSVGRIAARFARGGPADSAAGRLVADAQLAATKSPERGGAQLALMNPGGIRSDLECVGTPPCSVSFGQAFTMQPFGNSLVVLTQTGAQLKALLESQQSPGGRKLTILNPSAGFGYTWQSDAADGERVRGMTLNGEPVLADKTYRVTVNSFMAEGGDGFVLLKEASERIGGGQDLDAMFDYFKANDGLAPVATPRVTWAP